MKSSFPALTLLDAGGISQPLGVRRFIAAFVRGGAALSFLTVRLKPKVASRRTKAAMNRRTPKRYRSHKCRGHVKGCRRGAVLIMALVGLALVAVMGGTLVRWAALEHKLLRTKENESQARWLAEAAIERAAARLTSEADYEGETWEIAADELPSSFAARVRLRVVAVDDQPRRRSIEAEVEYPLEHLTPVRVSKQVMYQLPQGEAK